MCNGVTTRNNGVVFFLCGMRNLDTPELLNHVALWMPVIDHIVSLNLDVLLQDGHVAARAGDGESSGIMKVAVYFLVVLVIGIVGSKHGGAVVAGKVVGVVFSVQGNDVGAAQCLVALGTHEAQSSKVVSFA